MLEVVAAPTNSVININVPGDGLWFALLGLAGVLLGAVISGGFNYWVAWRKERADTKSERQRHDVEVRRAARLIDADLLPAVAAARISVDRRHWWGSNQPLTAQGWQQYREVIASELSYNDLVSVMVAVGAINDLQSAKDSAERIHRMSMALDPATADAVAIAIAHDIDMFGPAPMADYAPAQMEPMLGDLIAGRAVLAPLTQDPEPTS